MLGRIGIAMPYGLAAMSGVVFLFAAKGAAAIRSAGLGVLIGTAGVVAVAALRARPRAGRARRQRARRPVDPVLR